MNQVKDHEAHGENESGVASNAKKLPAPGANTSSNVQRTVWLI